MNNLRKIFKDAFRGWSEHRVPRLSAALSYYTIFSLAPLLVIAIAISSLVFGSETVNHQVQDTLTGTIGENGANAIHGMVQSASKHGNGVIATLLGVAMLLVGATGVFMELQASLNTIWEVEVRPDRGIWGTLHDRVFSLGLVMGTAFLLLVSLLASAALSGLGKYLSNSIAGGEVLWSLVNGLLSFAIVSVMFALLFKYVPDVVVQWKDVGVGAIGTGLLFTLGKALIGMYLGRSTVANSYGAAGSLAIVLLWIYYVSQIVFFGAEFTKAYATTMGSGATVDKSIAVPLKPDVREAAEAVSRNPRDANATSRGQSSVTRMGSQQATVPLPEPPGAKK